MSILPLAQLSQAADLFTENFFVFDIVSTNTLGRWQETVEPDRKISGVIQTSDPKKISFDADGAISDGTLMLHTRSTLSAYDLSQDGQVIRQTYVRYKGEIWKLNQLTNWKPKTGKYNLYYLTKYTNIGNI